MATYYVDALNGSDSWAGTAPDPTPAGSPTNGPWKTITKTNAAAKLAGDKILLRRGQTFDDATISFWTTTAVDGNRLVYGTYGVGNSPVFTTAKKISGLTLSSGKTYTYQAAIGANRCSYSLSASLGVYEDFADMVGVASADLVEMTPGSFYYDGTNNIYIHPFGSTDVTGKEFRAMSGDYSIRANNASYVDFVGVRVFGARRRAIYTQGSTVGVRFINCIFTRCEDIGVTDNSTKLYFYNCSAVGNYGAACNTLSTSFAYFTNCIVAGNAGPAFAGVAGSTVTYDHCNIYANGVCSTSTGYLQNLGAATFVDGGGNVYSDPKIKNGGYKGKPSYFSFTVDDSPNRPYAEAVGDIFGDIGSGITWYFGPTKPIDGPLSDWITPPSDYDAGTDEQWSAAAVLALHGSEIASHTRTHQRFATTSAGTGSTITNLFSIQYVGAGSAASMTVDDTSITVLVSGAADGITLSIADYTDISLLVSHIDGLSAYTCTLNSSQVNAKLSANVLKNVAGVDIKTAAVNVVFDNAKWMNEEIGSIHKADFTSRGLEAPKSFAYPYGFYDNTTSKWFALDNGYTSARTVNPVDRTTVNRWILSGIDLYALPVEFRVNADTWKIDTEQRAIDHADRIDFIAQCFPIFWVMLAHHVGEMPVAAVEAFAARMASKTNVKTLPVGEAIVDMQQEGWELSSDGKRLGRKLLPEWDWSLEPSSPCVGSGVAVSGISADIDESDIPGTFGVDIGPYSYTKATSTGFGPWTPFDATMPTLSLAATCPGKLLEVQEWKTANVTKKQIDGALK